MKTNYLNPVLQNEFRFSAIKAIVFFKSDAEVSSYKLISLLRSIFVFITFIFAPTILKAQIEYHTFEYDGYIRKYWVFLPQDYNNASNYPVVFNLHGYGHWALGQMNYSGMNSVADTAGFIVVYPQAVDSIWNSGIDDNPAFPAPDVDDVGFINALIDTLNIQYSIDLSRIYSCGSSNGGFMSYKLACQLGYRFAAIASVVGTISESTAGNCDSQIAIPVLYIHGTADPIVPYEGTTGWYSAEQTLQFWVNLNGCSNPDTTEMPDLNTNDNCTVERITYEECEENSKIIFFKIINGGHTWPGATVNLNPAIFGNTNHDINANLEIWNFFKDYFLTLPCLPEGITFSTQEEIDNFQTNYPGCTEIEGSVTIDGYDINNLNGLSVLTSIGGDLQIEFNNALTSLTGLDNLSSIGGRLWIVFNNALISLTGLDNVTFIGGDLQKILGNDVLASLTGLDNITSILGSLDISSNAALTSLTGLDNVTSIGGDLQIQGNAAMASLTGLENVTSIGGNLYIAANDTLTSLIGLDNLTSIGGSLGIGNFMAGSNPALTSLAGLENLTTIGGGLGIDCNPVLTSLTGLEGLNTINGSLTIGSFFSGNAALSNLIGLNNLAAGSIDNLNISYNSSLCNCDVQSICDYLTSPNGTIEIHDNAPGCNSQMEVEEDCENNCLPEGITFTTQAEIDNFQTNYPGCTEIEGDVTINGDDIANLNGLNILTSVEGYISIYGNTALASLSGINNLSSIGGDLSIGIADFGNPSLSSLTGLENLTSIEGNLNITQNSALTSLTGLNNLTSIGGHLGICANNALTNLSGLDNITTIGGYCVIGPNDNLTSLIGLNNLNFIGEDLFITYNASLSSLTGLENLSYVGQDLRIWDDSLLINLTGLDNLTTVEEFLSISNNYSLVDLSGLENLSSVKAIGIDGNYSLVNLTFLENLTSIPMDLSISHNPQLVSLSGFEDLSFIGGSLAILNNYELTSFSGLENLTSIAGSLEINENVSLTNLSGLQNLTVIGGDLKIGGEWFQGNPGLDSLTGLDNLISIGGNLLITFNASLISLTELANVISIGGNLEINGNVILTSLSGLENIEPGTISDLSIYENDFLSNCDAYSICEYLLSLNGTYDIHNNAEGCNSFEEVEAACLETSVQELSFEEVEAACLQTSVQELSSEEKFTIIPNPLGSSSLIQYTLPNNSPVTLKILDLSGREMAMLVNEVQQQGEQKVVFNTTGLPAGVYFCVLKTNEGIQTRKMIKLD